MLIWLFGAFILLIIAGNLIAYFERHSPHFKERSGADSFGEGLWWSINVVTNASFTIFTPVTRAGRTVAYGLIVVGLFVVSAFVAQITASLTVNELKSQVDGYRDLYDKRIGTTAGSTSAKFLKNQSFVYEPYNNLSEMMADLESGKLHAVVHDATVLAYFSQHEGRGDFRIVGRVFNPEKYGFALPQDSRLRERFNREILYLRETGAYQVLVQKWFGPDY